MWLLCLLYVYLCTEQTAREKVTVAMGFTTVAAVVDHITAGSTYLYGWHEQKYIIILYILYSKLTIHNINITVKCTS